MAKMRIHEFAKELEIAGKDILAILEEMGEGVKTVSSSIDDVSTSMFLNLNLDIQTNLYVVLLKILNR